VESNPQLWVQLGAALRAQREGRALRVSSAPSWAPHPDQALVLAPVFLPGDPDRIWAWAVGRPGGQPEVYSVPTPLDREGQRRMWAWATDQLARWAGDIYTQPQKICAPQLVVASTQVLEPLALAAQTMVHLPCPPEADDQTAQEHSRIRWWSRWVLRQVSGVGRPGSHSVVPVQQALDAHWVWPRHCANLRQRLAALEGSSGEGVSASPWEDAWPPEHGSQAGRQLKNLVNQEARARRSGWGGPEQHRRLLQIQELVGEGARQIWGRVSTAYLQWARQPWEPLPLQDKWCARDREIFTRQMERWSAGQPLGLSPGSREAMRRFLSWEALQQLWEFCLRLGDPWYLQQSLARGEVVRGRVQRCPEHGPLSWELQTPQSNCQLRVGDRVQVWEQLRALRQAGEGTMKNHPSLQILDLRVLPGGQLRLVVEGDLKGVRDGETATLVPQLPPGATDGWSVDERLVTPSGGRERVRRSRLDPQAALAALEAARREETPT